jgi:hypothetical protein
MNKLLFIFLSLLLFLGGCGIEPTPQEKAREASMADMRAKMQARQKQMFSKTEAALAGEAVYAPVKKRADKKDANDPTAYVYEDEVLTNIEEKAWTEAGIDNQEYPQWRALSIEAKEVKAWKTLDISPAAIALFHQQGYTPKRARLFMDKEFAARPVFYAQFGTPVYEFDSICRGVIKRQQPPFAFLEERCLPYMEASQKNEAIGHLLDEAKLTKGPLVLEYLAELRRLAEKNSAIQSGMEVSIEEFMEEEDKANFTFLFPLLINEPTKEEIDFIDRHTLALTTSERFYSYQNPQYWKKRIAAQDAAKDAAARQEALLRAKEQRQNANLQAEAAAIALKAKQAREKMAAEKNEARRLQRAHELCGAYIQQDELSGKALLIEGEVIFLVEERGSRMFGYGIRSVSDQKIYFIRDPQNSAQAELNTKISWQVKTMGRTEALSKIDATSYGYDKKSKTKYEMALLMHECRI